MTMQTLSKALFPLGQTVITPSCLEEIHSSGSSPVVYLHKHQHGEWGDLGEADQAENWMSVREGYRILSAYVLPNGKRIYCITEWDRSVTTVLLCSEY
jgi:hypothetical protein